MAEPGAISGSEDMCPSENDGESIGSLSISDASYETHLDAGISKASSC